MKNENAANTSIFYLSKFKNVMSYYRLSGLDAIIPAGREYPLWRMLGLTMMLFVWCSVGLQAYATPYEQHHG